MAVKEYRVAVSDEPLPDDLEAARSEDASRIAEIKAGRSPIQVCPMRRRKRHEEAA